MMKHRRLFNALWRNFEIICEEINRQGHHFAIEWPRACEYWRATKVIALLNRYSCVHAEFDGCMYGLKSCVRKDVLIKKPWRISATSRALHAALHGRLCNKDHEHTPCQGQDTKRTEEYTEEMVKAIHVAWRKHSHSLNKGANRCTSDPKGDPTMVVPSKGTVLVTSKVNEEFSLSECLTAG